MAAAISELSVFHVPACIPGLGNTVVREIDDRRKDLNSESRQIQKVSTLIR
jgi:hypothetical protein